MRRFAALLAVAVCLPAAISTSGAAAAGCPNEALRTGPSAQLPDCRAYEMVSPLDKNRGSINNVLNMRTSPSGDALSFYSTSAFSGAVASPLDNGYLGRREENWGTEAVDPPTQNPRGLILFASPASRFDQGITLQASTYALAPGAIEGGSNLYLRDNATGARTLLDAVPGHQILQRFAGAGGGLYVSSSEDWSHILLHSNVPLLEGLPLGPFTEHLYEYSDGTLKLVDSLPNGEISANVRYEEHGIPYRHHISADGSRIFFDAATETGEFGVYMREGGVTRAISVPSGTPSGSLAELGEFQIASADGSVVYFTSGIELTPGVETGGSVALYRYDVETETLTDITPTSNPGGPQVGQVLAASEDGSYVYFSAVAALTPDATEGSASEFTTNFYVWHDGQTKLVAQTEPHLTEFNFPYQYIASPNGRYFAFATRTALSPEDVPSPACPANVPEGLEQAEHCIDVYAFDYEAEEGTPPDCVTCTGHPARGDSGLGGQNFHEAGLGDEFVHSVLDDGTVYVNTPNALLPRDVNRTGDVYSWQAGTPQLVSTGKDEQPSEFGVATPDGSNVFFLTDQRLVGQDTDDSIDVYDDREGGGLASQYPAGTVADCEGEGCRGASSSPPDGLPPGSGLGAAAPSCGPAKASAKSAKQRAQKLTRRARQAARHKGTKAKHLRGQAAAAKRQAKQLEKKATNCGRQGR
ncbi:MAG TPA: hypothetical protein VGH14_21385 [Solirubrobacterales bacterium]|jgi:hypothetical protein